MTSFLQFLQGWPPELAVALLAVVPVTEVRAAIPLGIEVFHLTPFASFWWAFLGSLIPMPFVFWLFPPFLRWAEKHLPPLHRFLDRHVRALEQHHRVAYERWGTFMLFLFIALPIPGSGVWSASLLAMLFDIKRHHAALAIVAGIFTASLLVLGVTLGAIRVF